MITKVKNDEGKECFAIVLSPYDSMEDVLNIQLAIARVIEISTQSDLFDSISKDIYNLLDLLIQTLPTHDQIMNYQKAVFPKLVQL